MPESRPLDQWRPAIVLAVVSTVASLVVAALAIAVAGTAESALSLLRAAVQTWLVSLGASITLDNVRIDVVGIGATLIVFGLTWLLARLVVRKSAVDPLAFGAKVGGITGVIAAICSAVTSSDSASTSLVRSAFGAFLVVGLASALGAAKQGDLPWLGLPARWQPVAEGAATATIGVLGSATVITLVMLNRHLDQAADVWASLGPDSPLLLILMCVLAAPTLILWTTSVILGPGFSIGPDTSVDLAGSHLGAVPAFPPLAALPDPGPFNSATILLMLIPVLSAAVGGFVAYRQLSRNVDPRWGRVVADTSLAGVIAGLIIWLATETSGGAIGPGLMQQVGPAPFETLLLAVPTMAVGAALGGIGAHYRYSRDFSPS
ncbi:MAG TPA: DUF6350 family protein [Aeromicrobium sp.]|nr:DUF6350 family protein [Aeromicrobium sp.]